MQQSGGNPLPDDCSGAFAFHFSKPYLNQVGLQAGDQVFCQYWSRDPASPGTTGLTVSGNRIRAALPVDHATMFQVTGCADVQIEDNSLNG